MQPKPKRGVDALLSATELPITIAPTAEGRVKLALAGLELVLFAPQCDIVASGFEQGLKFAPAGPTITVKLNAKTELTAPREAVPIFVARLRDAGRVASQWQPE